VDLSPETIARFLTAYVVLLFSLSFHESAHAWMASRLGDQTARDQGRVSLNPLVHIDPIGTVLMPLVQVVAAGIPLLAWAKPTPVVAANFRPGLFRRGQVLAAAAGPVSNFLLALVFTAGLFVAARMVSGAGAGVFALEVLYLGVILNVALGVFNLVPLPPLDGSWIASFGLPRNLGEAYDRYVRPYGTMILLLLVVSGGLGQLVRPIMTGLHDLLFRLALPA
jgi:Zn-dependent protease